MIPTFCSQIWVDRKYLQKYTYNQSRNCRRNKIEKKYYINTYKYIWLECYSVWKISQKHVKIIVYYCILCKIVFSTFFLLISDLNSFLNQLLLSWGFTVSYITLKYFLFTLGRLILEGVRANWAWQKGDTFWGAVFQ